MSFVAGEAVWPTLRRLAETSGRKAVASAYLGDGMGRSLQLGEGDRLVVALTVTNSKNGSVSPFEVRRLLEQGVEVFVVDQLHAKVYLLGGTLAVGSANLTNNSATVLHEAVLVTEQRGPVEAAVRWFDEICTTPVGEEWLRRCEAIYKPPRSGSSESRAELEGRLWLVGVTPTEFPDDEDDDEAFEQAEELAGEGSQVEKIRFTGTSLFVREVKGGDLVIQAWDEEDERIVYPHGRVLLTHDTESATGTAVRYVYVEVIDDEPAMPWVEFREQMTGAGLKLGKNVGTREIKAPSAVLRAKQLTRPGGRRP